MAGRTFVERILLAKVADAVEELAMGKFIEDLRAAMVLPGVLATHVGRCVPVLGDHTFIMHVRAGDTLSLDAAYQTAYDIYMEHIHRVKMKAEADFKDIIIIDWESKPVGFTAWKWPAIRLAIVKFKAGTPMERVKRLEEVISILPSKFPLVKQVTWGKNILREKTDRANYGHADVDHDLAILLGFDNCQDLEKLGADPAYWELLNFHGISILEKYQVLTLCGD